MERKRINLNFDIPWPTGHLNWRTLIRAVHTWLPSRGNVLFTSLMIALLIAAQSVGALPLSRPQAAPSAASTGTIPYQGRLADADGNPLTDTVNMIFRLYDAASGGTPLWEEQWTGSNGVQVSDGLFNVMLGSLEPIPVALITSNSSLFLGITVDTDDEMAPRVQLGTVPFAVQALTVPDGSVTTEKIADGAVTVEKLARRLTTVSPSGDTSMPESHTWYDILSAEIDLDKDTLVTIHASAGAQNNQVNALFFTAISVDGTHVISGEKSNTTGLGNTLTMSTALMLKAGQHQIKLRASSWSPNGVIVGDTRTQLVIVEG